MADRFTITVRDDGPAPCRHCLALLTWDVRYGVWRDADGLVSCGLNAGPHLPVPDRGDIVAALAMAGDRA